jgi:hypothetical protein
MEVASFPAWGIQFDTAGNLCAQIRSGALSRIEVLSQFIARIGSTLRLMSSPSMISRSDP